MVGSLLGISVDNESQGGSDCSLNRLILTVKNMKVTNDSWFWDCLGPVPPSVHPPSKEIVFNMSSKASIKVKLTSVYMHTLNCFH